MDTNALPAAIVPSLSIAQFCAAENLSRSFLYKLIKQGKGPRMMESGRRKTVSPAAREAWQRAREVDAARDAQVIAADAAQPAGAGPA